jgi:hypothetical protein
MYRHPRNDCVASGRLFWMGVWDQDSMARNPDESNPGKTWLEEKLEQGGKGGARFVRQGSQSGTEVPKRGRLSKIRERITGGPSREEECPNCQESFSVRNDDIIRISKWEFAECPKCGEEVLIGVEGGIPENIDKRDRGIRRRMEGLREELKKVIAEMEKVTGDIEDAQSEQEIYILLQSIDELESAGVMLEREIGRLESILG